MRITFKAKTALVSAVVLLAASVVSASDIFVEEFADRDGTLASWLNLRGLEVAPITIENGTCLIDNPTTGGLAGLSRPLNPKPDVFTLTVVQKSSTGGAGYTGVLFNKQNDSFNGYMLTVVSNWVVVSKMVDNSGSISWGTDEVFEAYIPVFAQTTTGENKLTVSSNGSAYHIFANDEFLGEFSDAQYGPGDVALIVASGASATFGRIHMTNTFTEGGVMTEFSDDFTGSMSKYWSPLHSGSPDVAVSNDALNVTVDSAVTARMLVDINLNDFTARVETRHLSGNSTSSYGIVLAGETEPGNAIPMIYFAIRGDRRHAVYRGGTDYSDKIKGPDLAINGSVISGADVIEIKKSANSNTFEFSVNGKPLENDMSAVGFKIVSIGVFSSGGDKNIMTIAFDNFYVKEEGTASSIKTPSRTPQLRPSASRPAGSVFYDLKGRRRYTANAARTNDRARTRTAAGVYVNENGREVLIRDRRR